MKIKIEQLNLLPYADESYGQPRFVTFTFDDIRNAIAEKRYDARSFQAHFNELKDEWNRDTRNYDEYLERKKKYHIERIAYLVTSGLWKEPIIVCSDLRRICDGQHRVWAAKYLNEDEIEANVKENNNAAP